MIHGMQEGPGPKGILMIGGAAISVVGSMFL